jgi:lipopolysaccharide/colanic/teichoic acid biosynthesis glycosyltransferase
MQFIVIHKNNRQIAGDKDLVRFAFSDRLVSGIFFDRLSFSFKQGVSKLSIFSPLKRLNLNDMVLTIPQKWDINCPAKISDVTIKTYAENTPIFSEYLEKLKRDKWLTISDGRFAALINNELLHRVLSETEADVLAVNIKPELQACREKVRLTSKGYIAGFRRLYSDSAEPVPFPNDWPHRVFVKTNVLDRVLADNNMPRDFSSFIKECHSMSLTLRVLDMAGLVLDLETEQGLLSFCMKGLLESRSSRFKFRASNLGYRQTSMISQDVRFTGNVLLGRNISIGQNVVIVGPAIIGDNVKIEPGTVVDSSIIGSDVYLPSNQFVQNRVIMSHGFRREHVAKPRLAKSTGNYASLIRSNEYSLNRLNTEQLPFRHWPRFSYARCFKRIIDFFAAMVVLVLFAPVIPFIALAIKVSSPGSVFFKDKRQGLHGREFYCLKFRTMTIGADKIQEKLRIVSEVDGPQFKIADDPRINTVGSFLRETYIDEIPQFFNVLLGQMSVVGPRPSPGSENTLCPSWRDARLSVRPGITGLWQVCRTRQPMKDFQEWIYYDTKYVRDLSLKMDLWISLKTIKRMVDNFIKQF